MALGVSAAITTYFFFNVEISKFSVVPHVQTTALVVDMEPPTEASSADDSIAKLTKGMEHMRAYVSASPTQSKSPSNDPASPPPSSAQPPQPSTTSPADQPAHDDNTYGIPSSLINPPRRPAQRPPNPEKRSDPFQFGSRYLEEGDDIFEFNAWDHVAVDDTFRAFAETQYAAQRAAPVAAFDKARFNAHPARWWNTFYQHNTTNFFKNRKWLFQEFPALADVAAAGAGPRTVLEVGAGAGNTAFPIVDRNENPLLRIVACDYAKKAVELMRADPRCDGETMRAEVWDASAAGEEALPPGLGEGSVDIVVLIFIFSALAPDQWQQALWNVWRVLKPGGEVLLRDYGRGDLAQVRFKKGRYLDENFYVRGDGTRVYFFEEDELRELFGGEKSAEHDEQQWPRFEVVNLGTDRRMLVNRQRKLKMYRCWMQGRFRKPADLSTTPSADIAP
ncbi:hypothetical protein FH972_021419 [Carpinus fangiana]|uniref:Methyltransferase type 12 domain-containing protein n=1 Tax=Carpinus fangiana TaxID=176857 RepID=A0A5N6KPW7_9ROSI|nr:hypothetical protein FH972_021419 [Carpinus fangiana]